MQLDRFVGLGFVATFVNADPSVIAPLGVVDSLAVQVANGMSCPDRDELRSWLQRCTSYGLATVAWAWCDAHDVDSARVEARLHAEQCDSLGLTSYIANAEESYDAHGNSSSPRFAMLDAYVDELLARAAQLGLKFDACGFTSTPGFGSSQLAASAEGWACMPQAFVGAYPDATVERCVEHAEAWGWKRSVIRPLVQVYEPRPDATYYLDESDEYGVGVVPYIVEQAMDSEGVAMLRALVPATMRPFPTTSNGGDDVQMIGTQDGIAAACNRLRDLDPAGTLLVKTNGKWPDLSTLPADLSKWKAYDKLQRTLTILRNDHDEAAA